MAGEKEDQVENMTIILPDHNYEKLNNRKQTSASVLKREAHFE